MPSRDLGGGLVLRQSTPADADAIAEFNAFVFGDPENGVSDPGERAWARDLMTRPHPTVRPSDFTLVEETATGRIVSMMNLISQRWSYEEVEFGVGRPEMVGTHPDFRGRGLIRAQFDVIHRWSAERGQLVQAITGIPGFYRQFGYEMAVDLEGGREGPGVLVPALPDGGEEPYRVRPAAAADIGFIAALYHEGCRRSLVSCVRDEVIWRYALAGRSPDSLVREELRVIETPQGQPVGFVAHPAPPCSSTMRAFRYELVAGLSYAAVTPTVLRYLWATGQAYAAQKPGSSCEAVRLELGAEHPVYAVCAHALPWERRAYAWYVRVADLPGFLRLIAPVLERRLADSPWSGHTGALTLGFYRTGVRMVFEAGRLAAAEPWQPTAHAGGDAAFPHPTFLQLLFGHRSIAELRQAYPDCCVEARSVEGLLDVLFPRRHSSVWFLS